MGKKLFIGILIGWGLAVLISPKDVIGMFRARSS